MFRRLLLLVLLLLPLPAFAQTENTALDGDWDGALTVAGGISLRLDFHIGDGGTTAYIVSIDQGGAKIPVTSIVREGDDIAISAPAIHGNYAATLSADGKTMTGRWTQGAPLPLTLTRRAAGAAGPLLKRPQDPKPPYPYVSEDVVFDGPGGIHLAGTLTRPQGEGPFPAAVLIAGSGPQNRDEAILGHRPFLVLADALTRQGIAVLRADKRGVGKSTGDYKTATSRDFAADAEAAIAYLKTVKAINPRKIGLVGHSEGGLIAPMVAAADPSVAFIVLMAGPALKGEDILLMQQRLIAQAMGVDPEKLELGITLNRKIFDAIAGASDSEDAQAKAVAILDAAGVPADKRPGMIANVTAPWFRFFLTYDPIPALRQVKCPVLAIDGSLDLQVPPKEDLAAIKTALAHDRDVTVTELPGLNHLFQTARNGSPAEYAQIEETIAPAVLALIGDWVKKHTK